MRDLIRESDMLVDETGYWTRMPIAAALLWGGSMFLAAPLLTPYPVWSSVRTVFWIVATTLGGGVLFALLFAAWMRWLVVRNAKRAYRGAGKWSAPPPPGQVPDHRVPCTLVISPKKLVVGSLTLALQDAPLCRVVRTRRPVPDPISLPLGVVSPRSARMELTGVARLLTSRPPLLLELGPVSQTIRFLLPHASQTIPRIREAIDAYHLKGA